MFFGDGRIHFSWFHGIAMCVDAVYECSDATDFVLCRVVAVAIQDLVVVMFYDMHIKLWDRDVDDTFSIIKTHHIEKVFDTINNTTDGIIFTMGKEKDGEIAFLDMKLSRTAHGSIETQVYRKNRHTDQILNYHSNHPTQHKISCIRTLINRIDTHCNTTETKKN